MTQAYLITEGDVQALANAQSFDRGYSYYRNSGVSDIVRRGNLITAKVEGSEYEPYRVQVTVNETGIVDTSCTCPYDWGGICKHIVATLLVAIHEPETIVEKPALSTLLADLTADRLRQALIDVAEERPDFAEAIEREVTWLQAQPAVPSEHTKAAVFVDINAIRREIHKGLRQSGSGSSRYGYFDEYAGLELDPDEILQPAMDKVVVLLDAGDVATAMTLTSAMIEAYIDGLTDIDEWVYEYNVDVLDEANLTLGATLAEVLLSLDLQPDQQEKWLAQIAVWEDALGDLDIAKTAVEQGWSYPHLVAVMQGQITEKGAWEGEVPYYADELSLARLRILARRGSTQEYINLAEAEGQVELSIDMIAQSGDIDKAVSDAKTYLVYPQQVLQLAHVLATRGEMEAALNVAEYGLSLEEEMGKIELARWIREQAATNDHHPLALKAAHAAFTSSYELADYTAVQHLAGDKWQTLKPELLSKLQQCWFVSHKIDIYLHENMISEAMQTFDAQRFASDYDLRRVIKVTRETHPNWGIQNCKRMAEEIMDAGRSGAYDTAVSWLGTARDIYQQHQRQNEWETYLDSLLETHHRKYKLVPMLRNIRV